MQSVKLNKEKFSDSQMEQVQGLYLTLLNKGYEPKKISSSATAVSFSHLDDDGNRISMLIFVKKGQLVAVDITK